MAVLAEVVIVRCAPLALKEAAPCETVPPAGFASTNAGLNDHASNDKTAATGRKMWYRRGPFHACFIKRLCGLILTPRAVLLSDVLVTIIR